MIMFVLNLNMVDSSRSRKFFEPLKFVYNEDFHKSHSQNIEDRISEDSSLSDQSCDFFKDVLLHDYPAETFLQNTGIVLNILKILRDSNTLCPSVAREQRAVAALTRYFLDYPFWTFHL